MFFLRVLASLRIFEGLKLVLYKCSAGKWSIGYGTNLEDCGLYLEEAEFMLLFRAKRTIEELAEKFPCYWQLPQGVREILADMAYNMGVEGLLKFKKTLTYVESWDFEEASKEMLNSPWAKQVKGRAKQLSKKMKAEEGGRPEVEFLRLYELLAEYEFRQEIETEKQRIIGAI